MKKLIAGVCLVSLSACSASGMTMGLGAGLTIAGGAIALNQQEDPGCDPAERVVTGCLHRASVDAGNAISTVAGLTLVAFGVVLMGLGAWGASEAKEQPAGGGLTLNPAQPAPPLPSTAPGQTATTTAAAPALTTRDEAEQQKLALHIQLAARTNRCDAALYLLGRLRDLDQPRAVSLLRTDEAIARCALAKQAVLGG